MKPVTTAALCMFASLLYAASSQSLLKETDSQDTRASTQNCVWRQGDCVPNFGACGGGMSIESLTGRNCSRLTRQKRCRVPCQPRGKGRRDKDKTRSPSDAGLVGITVKLPSDRDGTYLNKLGECKYVKSEWSPCDPATRRMSRSLTLRKGDESVCKRQTTVMKSCGGRKGKRLGKGNKNGNHMKKKNKRLNKKMNKKINKKITKKMNRKRKNKEKKNCKYSKGQWGACHPKTNLQSRTVHLLKGSRKCPTTKTVARRCLSIADKCNTRKFPKRCIRRMQSKNSRPRGCNYSKGKWKPCDPKTNVKSRTLTLLSGDPKVCPQETAKVKNCRKSKLCKYTRGAWEGCDPLTRYKSRADQLKPSSPAACNTTRNVTKPCKQRQPNGKACQYKLSEWGECNPATNERNRTKTLIAGDTRVCKRQKLVTRSCIKPNGKGRCFFGIYGKYKPCQNGVKTKTRPVIAGPASCQRKAAKTKPCKKAMRRRN